MEIFFKDDRLPFVEARYSKQSQQQFKPHMHRRCCIGAIDRGVVEYSVAGKKELLSPGSLALINSEALHSCNALGKEKRSYLMLYLNVDWCLKVQKSLWEVERFVPFSTIKFDHETIYNQYCATLKAMFNSNLHLLKKEQLLFDTVLSIFQNGCISQTEKECPPHDISYLKKILSENLDENIVLNSFAQKLGANPYTLLRRFKAVTGITPHAYRMNCRVEQARKYLQEGMDIGDTALNCGFFDQSHLNRCFKAMTTVTPRQYRLNFIQ